MNRTPEQTLLLLEEYMRYWLSKYPQPQWVSFPNFLQMKANQQREHAMLYQKRLTGKCAYCGERYSPEQKGTRDHVIPKSKGGENGKKNEVLACSDCNEWKAAKHLKAWRSEVLFLLGATERKQVFIPFYSEKKLRNILFNISNIERKLQKDIPLQKL